MFPFFRSLSARCLCAGGNRETAHNNPAARRKLHLEALEERQLLAVTAGEFSQIRETYADLNLSPNYEHYNIIELTPDQLTAQSLQQAIDHAAGTIKDDLIVVRTNANKNTITLSGEQLAININAAQYGSVTIVSLGTVNLTIDGNKESRVFDIAGGADVGLAGLTITNGRANDDDQWGGGSGGGINVNESTATVTGCRIVDCYADSGGGIGNFTGTVTIANCTITGNRASWGGGGIVNGGGTVTITNGTIISNNSVVYNGGGITNSYGTLSVSGSTITNNTSRSGGGIHNGYGTLTVTDCTISGNNDSYGGGIFCRFADAVYLNSILNTMTLNNNVISGNSAYRGGGIYIQGGIGISKITNCTITGNAAEYRFDDSFVQGNGGGIYTSSATLGLYNSIVCENTGGSDIQWDSDYSRTITGFNNLTTFTGWLNPTGVVNYFYDPLKPLFVDAAKGDYRLAVNSQAINRGNNYYATAAELTTDLAGNPRIVGGTVDIGAYEYQGRTKLDTPVIDVTANNSDSIGVMWPVVYNASDYIIQYATDPAFTDKVSIIVNAWDLPLTNSGDTSNAPPFFTYTGYNITGLSPDTTYYVRVFATNPVTHLDSDDSETRSITTPPVTVTTPTNFRCPSASPSSVTLAWDVASNATGYKIHYRPNGTSNWTTVTVPGASTTSTTISSLTANTTYDFQIQSYNGTTVSAWSGTVTATASNKLVKPVITQLQVDGTTAISVF